MTQLVPHRTRILAALAAALGALASMAPAAHAGVLVSSATGCPTPSVSHPFLPWLDLAWYMPVGDGGFEGGGQDWALSGGAATVAGSESFAVAGDDDSRAAALPAGARATSPQVCVGLDRPTLRLFARRTAGGLLAPLRVDVNFLDAGGNQRTLTIGRVLGSSRWSPTLPLPVVVNLLALLGDRTPVSFTFAPEGGSSWEIDDVYVDPRKGA
jgi:hypothetical protein